MQIKVITRHTPNNYGSLLQSIATLRVIESLGHQCEIIDYWKRNEVGLQGILTSLQGKSLWKNSLFKRMAYVALRYPGEKIAALRFDKMRRRYLKLTPRCYSMEELESLQADVFMTGSDQVWGPLLDGGYDEAYFLSFVKEGIRKVSYAGSFGRTEFSDIIIASYKRLLSKYDALTVRESSAVKLLEEWGIDCGGQVLDPTLLLDSSQWSEYIEEDVKKEYVLIYEIHNNPRLDDYAKRFAAHVGLPLVRVSPTFHQLARGGRFVFCPEIGTFLSYIKNARYMLTDSFHGTAFAINFHTPFLEVLPNNKTGARNQSILQLTGLEDRIVTDFNDFSLADRQIDYAKVNEIMHRAVSYTHLRAHETDSYLVCRLLLEKKKKPKKNMTHYELR